MRLAMLVVVLLVACGGGAGSGVGADAGTTSGDDTLGAAVPGGGLTVEQTLDSDLDEPLLVTGSYLRTGSDPPRLCSALLESYPPQCAEPSLVVEGLDEAGIQGLKEEGSTVWASQVQVLGRVSGGTITVDPTLQS